MFRKSTCPSHKFVVFERRARGYWQKRECPGDGFYVPGVVEVCKTCGMMRLKPDDASLRTVEVTL